MHLRRPCLIDQVLAMDKAALSHSRQMLPQIYCSLSPFVMLCTEVQVSRECQDCMLSVVSATPRLESQGKFVLTQRSPTTQHLNVDSFSILA